MGIRMLLVGVESDHKSLYIKNLFVSWFGELGVARILQSSAAKSKIN